MEEVIRHASGEIALKTTIVEIPDPPSEIRPEDLTKPRLVDEAKGSVPIDGDGGPDARGRQEG